MTKEQLPDWVKATIQNRVKNRGWSPSYQPEFRRIIKQDLAEAGLDSETLEDKKRTRRRVKRIIDQTLSRIEQTANSKTLVR